MLRHRGITDAPCSRGPARILPSPSLTLWYEKFDPGCKALRVPKPQFVHAIYRATPGELLALIENHAPDARQVLLVGHNPGMEELLALLTEGRSAGARGMSPATVAWIDLTDDALEPGHGRLQALWSP